MKRWNRIRAATWAVLVAVAWTGLVSAQQGRPDCRISGKVTNGATALPGVALVAYAGEAVKAATSTDVDGTYRLALPAGAYRLTAQLTGFDPAQREIALGGAPCEQVLELQLSLAARAPRAAAPAAAATGRGAQRFETLTVQTQAGAAADIEAPAGEREPADAAARLLLPPGFSPDAPTEAVAVTGTMASLDRGMMNERFAAIGRGEFDPVTGEFREGFRPGGTGEFGGRGGGRGGPEGFGGQGGPGPGGRGGRGDAGFMIAGRGGRQNLYSGNANYTFGGSALDSSPYRLRADSTAAKRPYTRQNFNATIGGPVRIPGIYNGTRRTNFNLSYGGNRGTNLFDQYATVPSEAMRAGDFSSSALPVLDPATRQPFANNQIPADRMHAASQVLLGYIPLPNLPGAARNFHHLATSESAGDNLNLRITHNFTQAAGGRGGVRGGPGGGGGRAGGPGGRGGGRGQQGLNVVLNAQLQYRRNDNEQLNVLPTLGGRSAGSSITVPITLNVNHRRMMHNFNVNVTRSTNATVNRYAYVEDVAALAGISGVATDPFDWGVPSLSFSSLSSVRDLTPTRRSDVRIATGYTWSRPMRNHTLRIGGDFRIDRSYNQTDTNARGAFVFTGLYSGGGGGAARGSGLDFADFLLGLPQQASVQYGPGNVRMNGRSMSLFVQDDWRKNAALTLNLGVRYELLWPFVEANGQMVNLDVAPDFSAAAPVFSGEVGAFSGAFPTALMHADVNNLAPRVGWAWRIKPGNVLRGGYGMSFNSGSYPTIARQMVGQPPFAVTNTSLGTLASPLTLSNPLATASPTETANNYGVDRDYALGLVQTWNTDYSRDLGQVWNVGAGYTYTRGSSLDIVRAPNRGPSGLRIPGVQPFLWQTSEGASVLNAGTFRLLRRPVKGVGGGITYTVAKSRDNASTIGGGATVVAQDDQNLAAEWGLSSFDRRHQLSMDFNMELPFGQNRPWLNRGGRLAAVLENWRLSMNYTWQSGTPFTPRVTGSSADVARGTNGTLRANYSGAPVQIADPTIDLFFNTAAFTIPAAGTFGNASRNMIIGPGSRVLNAQLSRDIRLGGTRSNRGVGIQLNASNLLNTANYRAIDTVVNSPTFGQVTSVSPMRTMQLNVRFRF
jgi:hypothetical protein